MTIPPAETPLMFIVAWLITTIGALAFGVLLFLQPPDNIMKGGCMLAAALLSVGVGEILNHPKEHVFVPDGEKGGGTDVYQRRRNICALGNLLLIAGVLLFFVGIGNLFYA